MVEMPDTYYMFIVEKIELKEICDEIFADG